MMPFQGKKKEDFLVKGLFTNFSKIHPDICTVYALKPFYFFHFVSKELQYDQLYDSSFRNFICYQNYIQTKSILVFFKLI